MRTAEAAYGSLAPEEQRLARRLFLRLVHVADDAPPTRATVRLGELEAWGGESEHVLGRFVDERLITVDADAAQITHDALLTAWPRLRSWIDDGQEDLRTRRRITEAARELAGGRAGKRRPVARQPARDRQGLGGRRGRSRLARHAGRRVRRRVDRGGAGARARRAPPHPPAAAARRRADGAGGRGGRAGRVRVPAASGGHHRARRRQLPRGGASRPARSAARTRRWPRSSAWPPTTPPVPRRRRPACWSRPARPPPPGCWTPPAWSSRSASARTTALLAVAAADGTLRLWDVAAPGHPVPVGAPLVQADDSPLYATAFSPDGKILAAAGAGRTVALWNVSRPGHPVRLGQPLTGPANTVYSVAFSPDGKTLAAGSADDTVRLWDVADPAHPAPLGKPLTGPAGYVRVGRVQPRRDRCWRLAARTRRCGCGTSPTRPRRCRWAGPLTGPRSIVTAVAFSPAGSLLAAASQDDKVWLWNVAARRRPVPDGTLTGAANWVNTVAFSPDGTCRRRGHRRRQRAGVEPGHPVADRDSCRIRSRSPRWPGTVPAGWPPVTRTAPCRCGRCPRPS